MGHKRSLLGCYREEKARLSPIKPDKPTAIPGAWKEACKRFSWNERAGAWDRDQARSTEEVVKEARSSLVKKQVVLEGEWLDREAELRAKAHDWLKKYLFGEVIETRTTEKEKTGEEGMTYEKSTITAQKAPPAWVLERFTGKRDYEKQFNVLMELLKSIMSIEEDSEHLQRVKSMIQASLEGLLLESGVEEVRTLLNRGHS